MDIKKIAAQPFCDKQFWKDLVVPLRESYFQFELCVPNGRWVGINANQKGVDRFVEQIERLNIQNFKNAHIFELQQEIEPQRLRHGVAYLELFDEEEDFEFNTNPNLTGYMRHPINETCHAANKVLLNWRPHSNQRTLTCFIDDVANQVTFEVNPQGLQDLLCILKLFQKQYRNIDIILPNEKLLKSYPTSNFYLTPPASSVSEEQFALHVKFYKEFEMQPIINFVSSTNKGEEVENNEFFFQTSARGSLELKYVLYALLRHVQTHDYMDYQIEHIDSEMATRCGFAKEHIKLYTRVRFVFLRDVDLYLISMEYDEDHDILYIFISALEINKLIDKFSKWQADWGGYIDYAWVTNDNLTAEEFRHRHQYLRDYDYLLTNCRYGLTSWYTFKKVTSRSVFPRGGKPARWRQAAGIFIAY